MVFRQVALDIVTNMQTIANFWKEFTKSWDMFTRTKISENYVNDSKGDNTRYWYTISDLLILLVIIMLRNHQGSLETVTTTNFKGEAQFQKYRNRPNITDYCENAQMGFTVATFVHE